MRDQLSVRLSHGLNEAMGERAKRDARRPSDAARLTLQACLHGVPSEGRRGADRIRETSAAPAWGESESPEPQRTIVLRHVSEELYQAR